MMLEIDYEITVPITIEKLWICPVKAGDKIYHLFLAIDPDKTRQYEMTEIGSSGKYYRIELKPEHPKWEKAVDLMIKWYPYFFGIVLLALAVMETGKFI